MKKEMCRGCDNLKEKIKTLRFESDGVTRIDPPRLEMRPFCIEHQLHVDDYNYIERIYEGDTICPHYRKDGVT